jgi:hypothetical protein
MSLTLVPTQPKISSDIKKADITKKIRDRITELNLNLPQYKNNAEFTLLVLNMIEYLVKKKYKIDKKALAVEILMDLFQLNPVEVDSLQNNIEFLHSNKMIKKVSWYYAFCCGVIEYFGRSKN